MKNVFTTAAAVAVLALGAVSAQAQVQSAEAGFAPDVYNAQSTHSRQDVNNTFLKARQDGTLALISGDKYRDPSAANRSSLARADVQREAVAAAHSGAGLTGEGSVQ